MSFWEYDKTVQLAPMVKRYPRNVNGRDFIVGDVHGHYYALDALIREVKFNPDVDRLFLAGDMTDRGPQNDQAFNWVTRPYVHFILGNHDTMLIEAVRDNFDNQHAEVLVCNGGQWVMEFLQEPKLSELKCYTEVLKAKGSFIAVVGDGEWRYNILHAEFVGGSDKRIDNEEIEDHKLVAGLLWGRDITRGASGFDDDLSTTFVGHTNVYDATKIGNHVFIDTSGGKNNMKLTMIDPNSMQMWTATTNKEMVSNVTYERTLDGRI